jgi:hypothetical protein
LSSSQASTLWDTLMEDEGQPEINVAPDFGEVKVKFEKELM